MAIVYFGKFYKNYRCSPKFWATFFLGIDYVLNLPQDWLGCTSAIFSQSYLVTLIMA
jgi:hypothetical protein